MKYLLRNNDDIYRIADGQLEPVEYTDIDAELFGTYGMDEVPGTEQILSLDAPVLLCWDESDFTVRANVTAAPPVPQLQTSKYIAFDNTIAGIKKITITGSDDILCRFSFKNAEDEENIWMVWNLESQTWKAAEDEEWNTKGEVEAAKLYPEMTGYNIQVKYPTLGSYLTGLKVDHINATMNNKEVKQDA